MRAFDEEHHPDPKKVTVYKGAIFNPWVNIPACIILTLVLAGATWWAIAHYVEVSSAPPYPDQGLDTAGLVIGATALGVATLGLFVSTILTIRWWSKRIRAHSR